MDEEVVEEGEVRLASTELLALPTLTEMLRNKLLPLLLPTPTAPLLLLSLPPEFGVPNLPQNNPRRLRNPQLNRTLRLPLPGLIQLQ